MDELIKQLMECWDKEECCNCECEFKKLIKNIIKGELDNGS